MQKLLERSLNHKKLKPLHFLGFIFTSSNIDFDIIIDFLRLV